MPTIAATDDGGVWVAIHDPSGVGGAAITRCRSDGSSTTITVSAFPMLLHPDGTIWFLDDERSVAVDLCRGTSTQQVWASPIRVTLLA